MGGCNGWVFERVKLAQANLLPMGLPHLVSQYSLILATASPERYNPTNPPAGFRPRQESSRSGVTEVTQGRMFTLLVHSRRVGQGNTKILRLAEYV